MTVNANYNPPCYTAYATGFADIRVAVPFNTTALPLGVVEDMVRPREEYLTSPVNSDQHGGQQGSPVEIQDLGEIHRVTLNLSTFNIDNHRTLKTRALRATAGAIPQAEIGQFIMTGKACRLLINTGTLEDTRNYWCAIPDQPFEEGIGTKAQMITWSFSCYRPPCSHPKVGILYDTYSADAYA